MYATPKSPHPLRLPEFFTHWMVGLFMAVLLALTGMAAHAAAPAAGASISNQASASYFDATSTPRTVTSNTVSTTVTQVTAMTLTANGAQTATPGSVVYYPHTLTNTGNGTDTFNLTGTNTAGAFNMTSVKFFADSGSGTPTGPEIFSTGPLAAGTAFKLIAVGTLPNTATATQTNTITVTGTSATLNTTTASNTDLTTVTTNAVVTLTKGITATFAASGAPGTTTSYTLTYTNTGNSTANNVVITDVIPTGMTFQAGTARWSVTGLSTDALGAASVGTGLDTMAASIAGQTFTATLARVTAGQSGTISFQVKVDTGIAAPAPGVLNNVATTSYNNGAATVTGTSNTVPFNVLQTAAVTLLAPATIASANPDTTISYDNVVTNTGTGTDSFNITLGTSTFPFGTTFQLFKAGGLTPLVDTNGDGIPDTGPMAAGTPYTVVVKATLPPNATTVTGGSLVNVIATSKFDPTKSANDNDKLTAIVSAKVDLTNDSAAATGVPGFGVGTDTAAQSKSTNPGTTTIFTLVTNNTGPSADSYNLTANNAFAFGGTLSLPAGWTVTFKESVAGACTTTGASIVNTGSVLAGSSVTVCAVVTVPAGFAAGNQPLYFRALSPTSGVSDIIRDDLTVNAVRAITVTPNGAGQTYPGGSYVYSHTLTNNGNVLEGNGTVSTLALTTSENQALAGWTSTLYLDAGSLTNTGNGVLDNTDPIITGNLNDIAALAAGLAPGKSVTIFTKVIAPSGAVGGSVNATSVTVTTSQGTYTLALAPAPAASVAVDSTTVIVGNLSLVKEQALVTCGVGGALIGTYGTGNLSAKPGECVSYRITATNIGSGNATTLVVSDATPTFTKINTTATMQLPGAAAIAATTTPAVGLAGAIGATIGTLKPAESAVLLFSVQLDN